MCVRARAQDCKGQLLLERQRGGRFVAFTGEWESGAKRGGQHVDIFKRKERKKERKDAGIKKTWVLLIRRLLIGNCC